MYNAVKESTVTVFYSQYFKLCECPEIAVSNAGDIVVS